MDAVALIDQHGVSIFKVLIIINVVKCCCSVSTATDGVVRSNPPTCILLLAVSLEYGHKLRLSHAWFAVSHVLNMSLASNS